MSPTRFLCLALALCCLLSFGCIAMAAQVDCDTVYCFTQEDFAPEDDLTGICITDLPDASAGTVMLGSRVIREGDILTTQQLPQLTFNPLLTDADKSATVTYLPVYKDHVAASATLSIAVRGKQDNAPVAEDFSLETYKNLPNQGALKVSDPEGEELTYSLQRKPKRGEVTLDENGNFLYTPKKNKIGVDSFTYTATDPAGNVSREATVTITIVKPTDATQYTDTAGSSCRFAAEWMKNTGIFTAESIGGNGCFQPGKEVSRGEFVTMLVGALDLQLEEDAVTTGFSDECASWLKPYLAAAMRSGLMTGWIEEDAFHADAIITGTEAAAMIQNALELPEPLELSEANLTRGEAAEVIYQVSQLKSDAPGLAVLNTKA